MLIMYILSYSSLRAQTNILQAGRVDLEGWLDYDTNLLNDSICPLLAHSLTY